MRLALLLSAAMFLAAGPSASRAAIYDVRQDGTGDFTTIAAALAVAVEDDVVRVYAGTYVESDLSPAIGVTVRGAEPTPSDVIVGRVPGAPAFDLDDPWSSIRIEHLRITGCDVGVFADSDVSIRSCVIDSCSKGVELDSSTAQIEECVLFMNGTGVHSRGGMDLVVADTHFEGNASGLLGEGIGTILVEDCDFVANGAPPRGGMMLRGLDGIVRRTRFEGNSPHGVLAYHRSAVLFEDCEFGGNGSAVAEGGALACKWQSEVELVRCSFTGNQSYRGAVFIAEDAGVSATDCEFRGNSAAEAGGAFALWDHPLPGFGARLEIVDSELVDNTAGLRGGGIHVEDGDAVIRGSTIAGNSAPTGGGISAVDFTTVSVEGSVVAFNSGQIHVERRTEFTLVCANVYPADHANALVMLALSGPGNRSADPAFCDAPWGSIAVHENSMNLALPACAGSHLGSQGAGCPPSGVYVFTDPPGLSIHVNGEESPGGRYVPAQVPTVLEVSAPTVQLPGPGIRYTYFGWSDGGAQTHAATYSDWTDAVTAIFSAEYELTTSTSGDGSISPAGGWYPAGETVWIEATPAPGSVFFSWLGEGMGSYTGSQNPIQVTLDSPVHQEALFAPAATVRIESDPPGAFVFADAKPYVTPVEFPWRIGAAITISVDSLQTVAPGHRLRYGSWSGGLPRSHAFIVQPEGHLLTVTLETDYELTFEPEVFGTVSPGDGWHPEGAVVPIQAVANSGLDFVGWAGSGPGSYSGPANPAQVTLGGPVHQDALFVTTTTGGHDLRVSASATDPQVQVADPTDTVRSLYLWLTCSAIGASALEANVNTDLAVYGFDPAPGVLNAGSATELLLAIGGCPEGPEVNRLLGTWNVWDSGGSLCLGSSAANGWIGVVDCDPLNAQLHEDPRVFGFASAGPPCEQGANGCGPGPVSLHLSNLRAEPADRMVRLSWETALEVDHAGFHVYRGRQAGGPWALRTESLLTGRSPHAWEDRDVEADVTYFYEVGALDTQGVEVRYGPVQVTTPRWAPLVTALAPVRPNPFRREARVAFSLAAPGRARISVFDVTGRLVRTLEDGTLSAGEHVAAWDGRDSGGLVVPAGVYFTRLEAGGVTTTRKIVRLGVR